MRSQDIGDRLARADAELPPQPAPAIDFVTVAASRRRRRLAAGLIGAGAVIALLPFLAPPAALQTNPSTSGPDSATLAPPSRAHQAAVQAAAALSRRLEEVRRTWSSPTGRRAAATRERACRTEIRARLATIRADAAIALANRADTAEPNRSNR